MLQRTKKPTNHPNLEPLQIFQSFDRLGDTVKSEVQQFVSVKLPANSLEDALFCPLNDKKVLLHGKIENFNPQVYLQILLDVKFADLAQYLVADYRDKFVGNTAQC